MLKNLLKLFSISSIILFACTNHHLETPPSIDMGVEDYLSSKNNILSIETIFSITFEKEDEKYKGDGYLNISKNGDMTLRIYYLGFLRFEMTSRDNIVKSTPMIDMNKSIILTEGLRVCFFWWDIPEFEILEQNDAYKLENTSRRLWFDRKTKFPLKQNFLLSDGRELRIFYGKPEKIQDIWYPLKIRIELSSYAVNLNIKEISFSL